jgi:hypothetical protein
MTRNVVITCLSMTSGCLTFTAAYQLGGKLAILARWDTCLLAVSSSQFDALLLPGPRHRLISRCDLGDASKSR